MGLLGDWNSPDSIGLNTPTVAFDKTRFLADAQWNKRVAESLRAGFPDGHSTQPPRPFAREVATSNMLMKDPALLQTWLTVNKDRVPEGIDPPLLPGPPWVPAVSRVCLLSSHQSMTTVLQSISDLQLVIG